MISKYIKISFYVLFASSIFTSVSYSIADINDSNTKNNCISKSIFNKYQPITEKQQIKFHNVKGELNVVGFPGWIIGKWKSRQDDLFFHNWRYRKITYEILFPSKSSLAELIYSLACYTKDLDESVSLERFKRGAQGFHYSVEQLVQWANSLVKNQESLSKIDDRILLQKLLDDQVLVKSTNGYKDTGKILHLIGAAPGKKRGLALNLNHERWHIIWDEDIEFRELCLRKWQNLPNDQKSAVFRSFPGYNHANKMLIIEEWAVKEKERIPIP